MIIQLAPNGVPLGPSGPFLLSPGGDVARQRVQAYLYHTQFYKGRTDGHPDPERMDAAIKFVKIAAHLPPYPYPPTSGDFNDDVRLAIERYQTSGDFQAKPPPPPPPPNLPIGAMPTPQRSLVRDLATFAILTSPAWGLLLLLKRPWTKLGAGARGR